MALSDEDAALLANLKKARDAKLSGRSVANVSTGGRSVAYRDTSLAEIEAAIDKLEKKDAGGSAGGRGAIRFRF